MIAVYLKDGTPHLRTDFPRPQATAGSALIKVTLAGVCATDLELVKGYGGGFEGVLGHEFVGEVIEAAHPAWPGRRVTGTINLGCGTCAVCLAAGPEHCPSRTVLGILEKDGAFAEYVTLPLANLVPLPDELPDQQAVFCEPLAAALRIREQVIVKPTARIAVVGPGRLGMLIGKVLSLAGGSVTMLGRSPTSLELPHRWGLSTSLVDDEAAGEFNFVVETTGNPAGFDQALRLVRPTGTIILKSTYAGRAPLDLTRVVVDEITVVGSRCGPFEPAVRLLATGVVPVADLIDGRYPLEDALAAFEHAARPGVRKILLEPPH